MLWRCFSAISIALPQSFTWPVLIYSAPREDFQADIRTVDAVVHFAINGLRNRIAHEYFGLSLSVIWAIVQIDLPILAQQLASWRSTNG